MTSPGARPGAALALDAYLSALTPADREALRAATPTHVRDQLDAAASDAHWVQRASVALSSDPGAVRSVAVPEWVRLSVLDALVRFVEGTASTCLHSPTADRPQPLLAAAWRPGLVVCLRCAHLLRVASAANLTCDLCGRVCAPVDGGAGIHPCSVRLGVLLFAYGLCSGCLADHEGQP